MNSKTILRIIIYLLFIANCQQSVAQMPNLLWAKQIGGSRPDFGHSIITDAANNVYAIGEFGGTVDFDPGPGIFNLTAIGFAYDIFIQKLDANGNHIWTKQIGGSANDEVNSIVIDGSGNVYTTGTFEDTVDFDPGAGVFNLISNGTENAFIQKLDSNGNFIWARQLEGSFNGSNNSRSYSVTVDATDHVYITGAFADTVDFDPGTGTYDLISQGFTDIYILKLDSSGNFNWVKQMGGTQSEQGFSITTDGFGSIYTTGLFRDSVDFDPGTGVYNLVVIDSGGTNFDIFIHKIDTAGNFTWVKQMGTAGGDGGYSIDTDLAGYVYNTGYFNTGQMNDSIDFDLGPGVYNIAHVGAQDHYIQKLDSSGNIIWVTTAGNMITEFSYALTIDNAGSVYATGRFCDSVDFDPGPGTYFLTSNYCATYFQKLNTYGNFVWAFSVQENPGNNNFNAITVNTLGDVYTIGSFRDTVDIDPGANLYNFASNGYYDIYIQKLGPTGVGISENTNESEITIYPNPTSNGITISLPDNPTGANIIITDLTGKAVYKNYFIESRKIEVDTDEYSEGIYLVQVSSEHFIETRKVVILK